MKRFLLLSFLFISLGIQAQNVPPQAINFQGVAIDKNGVPVPGMDEVGNPIQNASIRIRFTVLMGSATGTPSYQEEHLTNTDEFGRFNLEIGRGTALLGQFTDINWGADRHFLKVETDLTGIGSAYTLSSVQEFLSVPYALYAKTAGNSSAAGDQDSTNEIQQLSLNGTALSLSKANTVNLPADLDAQQLQVSGNTLSISGGNNVQLPVSLDNDTTNELQDLFVDAQGNLKLTKSGTSIPLPKSNSLGSIKNIPSSSYCLYPKNVIATDSMNSYSVAYENDTQIVVYKGSVVGSNYKGVFYHIKKQTDSIFHKIVITHNSLNTSGTGVWYLNGYYRPNIYIVQLGGSTNVYTSSGSLMYGSASPGKWGVQGGFSMGDSLMFTWAKPSITPITYFGRMNVYNNLSSGTSITLCSNCGSINFTAKASGDVLFIRRLDNGDRGIWPKNSTSTLGYGAIGNLVKVGPNTYGFDWIFNSSGVNGTLSKLNSTYDPIQSILNINATKMALGNVNDTALRIVFETSTSQVIGYQSVFIPDQSKSFMVETIYVPLTGQFKVLDITQIDGSPEYYVDGRTGKISMIYNGTTCYEGKLNTTINRVIYFD